MNLQPPVSFRHKISKNIVMFWTPLAQEIEVIAGSAPISVLRNHPLVSFRHVIWKTKFWTPLTKENKISKILPLRS